MDFKPGEFYRSGNIIVICDEGQRKCLNQPDLIFSGTIVSGFGDVPEIEKPGYRNTAWYCASFEPTPDLSSLLARCKVVLQEVSAQKEMVRTIEQYEDYTGGVPSLGTCKKLGQLKTIADKATALLSEIAKAESGR